jgi:hypothetical protein
MINIEQITARLAKLPDQALQQYAMMHKEDPYIMALAVSESNRRKQIRAAGQVQAQEQPKVADQALMDMAPQQSPDEAGIAGLAAGDMNFADGGIVEHYQVGGSTYETPYDRMNRLNRERAAAAAAAGASRSTPTDTNPYSYGYDPLSAEKQEALRARATAPKFTSMTRDLEAQARFKQMNGMPLTPAETVALENSKIGSIFTPGPGASGVTPVGQSGTEEVAAPVEKPQGLGGTKEAAALRGAKPTGTTPAAPAAAAPSIADAKTLAGQFLDTKAAEDVFKKFATDEEAAIAKQRAEFNKDKPQGKAYSKYEEMLSKEEAGAGKEKDEALGLAIFKAGLGMMAGSSPHAFENIGKGAMAGLDDYSSAMKDMKKAARERQKAMADIDNARRAEERDDWKTSREFENKASERLSKARELGVRGIMDITGKSAEIASGIYKTQVTEGGLDRRAKLQADTTLAAAKIRGDDRGELTPKDRAAIADKAMDNVNAALKANTALQIKVAKDPAYLQTLVQQESARLLAAAEGRTIAPAPGAQRPGGTSLKYNPTTGRIE